MGNIMGNIFERMTDKSANATIAYTTMSAAAASATTYLAAMLESSTPEVRRLYSDYLTQSIMEHEAITALSLKKGWFTPYDAPETQLQTVFQQSKEVTEQQQ